MVNELKGLVHGDLHILRYNNYTKELFFHLCGCIFYSDSNKAFCAKLKKSCNLGLTEKFDLADSSSCDIKNK